MDPVQITTLILVGIHILMSAFSQLRIHGNCGKGRNCILFSEKDGNKDTKEIIAMEDGATITVTKNKVIGKSKEEDGKDEDGNGNSEESISLEEIEKKADKKKSKKDEKRGEENEKGKEKEHHYYHSSSSSSNENSEPNETISITSDTSPPTSEIITTSESVDEKEIIRVVPKKEKIKIDEFRRY